MEERPVESADRLVEKAAGASGFRVSPELPERAQSTLEEELTEERRRREEAEGGRYELAARLAAPEGARGIPRTAAGDAEGEKPRPAAGGSPEAARPSWWRRR